MRALAIWDLLKKIAISTNADERFGVMFLFEIRFLFQARTVHFA